MSENVQNKLFVDILNNIFDAGMKYFKLFSLKGKNRVKYVVCEKPNEQKVQ